MDATRSPAPSTAFERRWWTLAVLCLSLLIVFVGNSSLNVTLPTLARVLHANGAELQWVVAAYSLVFAGLLFSTGSIGDRYGRKGALQLGFVLFLIGAGLASASHAMWQVIACRALMGAGAALIMPSTLSILINVFPPHERPRAIAIWASVTGAAGALGPIASGLLLAHFWWGSVFLINVPLILVALIGGRFLVPKSRDHEHAPLDPVGAALSTIGIVALVYGLIEAPSSGWLSGATLGSFAIAVVVLGAFVLWELRAEHPTLDIRYFLNRAFSIGTGGMILVFLALYGVIFLLTLYFQLVLGYSPLSTAVRFVPIALIMILISPQTPRLTGRFGAHRTVGAGMALVAVGLLELRGLGLHTSYAYVVACLVPIVGGMALSISPMTASIMSAVPPRRAGAGSAMNDTTRELGAALGVAVLGSLAASRYASGLQSLVRALAPAARATAQSSLAGALQVAGSLPRTAGAALATRADRAFVDGFHLAGIVGAVLAAASAVIVACYLPRRVSHAEAQPAPVDVDLVATVPDYPEDEAEPVAG
ncbi:MAG TPA: MFS transporter [Actinomycetota bacterium]|nr:MFS transporter [Actinomycetota bacterium]